MYLVVAEERDFAPIETRFRLVGDWSSKGLHLILKTSPMMQFDPSRIAASFFEVVSKRAYAPK